MAKVWLGDIFGIPDPALADVRATVPYIRPKEAGPFAEHYALVYGCPCVVCGKLEEKMVPDHKLPLVVEHYTAGRNDIEAQTRLEAFQAHCKSCSRKQGAYASRYSIECRRKLAASTL